MAPLTEVTMFFDSQTPTPIPPDLSASGATHSSSQAPSARHVQDELLRATNLFKAVNHQARLLVLCRLVDGEKTVGELQELTGTTQSAMSQHLRLLRQLRLVKNKRRAQMVYYSIEGKEVPILLEMIHRLYPSFPRWTRDPAPCAHYM
ncbi:MAG: metalloregulator ArsR/SmtB family transcription factor [Rhodospirillales bacterium]